MWGTETSSGAPPPSVNRVTCIWDVAGCWPDPDSQITDQDGRGLCHGQSSHIGTAPLSRRLCLSVLHRDLQRDVVQFPWEHGLRGQPVPCSVRWPQSAPNSRLLPPAQPHRRDHTTLALTSSALHTAALPAAVRPDEQRVLGFLRLALVLSRAIDGNGVFVMNAIVLIMKQQHLDGQQKKRPF